MRSAMKLEEALTQQQGAIKQLRPLVSSLLLLMDSLCDVCPCATNGADVSSAIYAIKLCMILSDSFLLFTVPHTHTALAAENNFGTIPFIIQCRFGGIC